MRTVHEPAEGASPAAAAGQEEADEEVMLGVGIDVVDAEHGSLVSADVPVGDIRNSSNRRVDPSMKIGFRIREDPPLSRAAGSPTGLGPGRPVRLSGDHRPRR